MMSLPAPQSAAMEAFLAAAQELDQVEEMIGLCALLKLLPLAHKTFVQLLMGQLIEEERKTEPHGDPLGELVGQDASKADFSRQPLDKLLTLVCHLTPAHPLPVRQAVSAAIHHAYTHPTTNPKLLHHLLTMASIHPALFAKDRETFAIWAASALSGHFPIITELPLSPANSLGSTGSPRSLSPMNSSHASLSPQNSAGSSGIGETGGEGGKENRLGYHAPLGMAMSDTAAIMKRNGGLVVPKGLGGPVHRSLSSSPHQEENGSRMDLHGSCSSMVNAEPFIHVPQPGMRDVPGWLKTLRLHKYCGLLANKTYEELIGITEVQLEAWNVTKGARGKIALCIQKLRERPEELRQLAQQAHDPGQVRNVVLELRNLLGTPIKMTMTPLRELESVSSMDQIPPNDIAARITFVIKTVAAIRLNGTPVQQPDDDTNSVLLQITERCLHHEAFYGCLRSTLQTVKHNLHMHLRPGPFQGHRKLTKCYTNTFDNRAHVVPHHEFFVSSPPGGGCGGESRFRPLAATASVPVHRPLQRMYAVKGPAAPVPLENDKLLKPRVPIGRAKSAPLSENESNLWFDGLYPELETLTLSVTEHALDSFEHTSY